MVAKLVPKQTGQLGWPFRYRAVLIFGSVQDYGYAYIELSPIEAHVVIRPMDEAATLCLEPALIATVAADLAT